MRVPLPFVILLALAVVGGTWWWNTHSTDFLTPPGDDELAAIRAHVEASLPGRPDHAVAKIELPPAGPDPEISSAPPPEPEPEPELSLQLGDLRSSPSLATYAELASNGSTHLIELASELETEGEFQRSLLAWERVLDRTHPDPPQAATAINAIRRLRPTLPDWNVDPQGALPLVLHASTGPSLSKDLAAALEQTARELEAASSGILGISHSVATGRRAAADAPTPAAIWLAGAGKNASSTEVLSFTVSDPEALPGDLLKNIYRLIAGHLERSTDLNPPLPLPEGESSGDPLDGITRLAWEKLGISLNTPSS